MILVVCAAALLLSGCAGRRARAFPWSAAVLAQPRLPAPAVLSSEAELPPELQLVIPDPPPRLISSRSLPPRPRSANGADAGEARAEAPLLAPQLSPQEAAAAQQQTNESLAIAERNLKSTSSRSLSPTQSDLVSKIRRYIDQAGEAAHEGDWARARTLAKKAQVLSQDLARSL